MTFDQAALIAAIKKEALKVRDADRLKKAIAKEKDQEAFFKRYLLNKAVLSNEESEKKTFSLDSLLGNFLSDCTDEIMENENWVKAQKDNFTPENIVAAYKRIISVAQKLNVTLEDNQNSTESKETI